MERGGGCVNYNRGGGFYRERAFFIACAPLFKTLWYVLA